MVDWVSHVASVERQGCIQCSTFEICTPVLFGNPRYICDTDRTVSRQYWHVIPRLAKMDLGSDWSLRCCCENYVV